MTETIRGLREDSLIPESLIDQGESILIILESMSTDSESVLPRTDQWALTGYGGGGGAFDFSFIVFHGLPLPMDIVDLLMNKVGLEFYSTIEETGNPNDMERKFYCEISITPTMDMTVSTAVIELGVKHVEAKTNGEDYVDADCVPEALLKSLFKYCFRHGYTNKTEGDKVLIEVEAFGSWLVNLQSGGAEYPIKIVENGG